MEDGPAVVLKLEEEGVADARDLDEEVRKQEHDEEEHDGVGELGGPVAVSREFANIPEDKVNAHNDDGSNKGIQVPEGQSEGSDNTVDPGDRARVRQVNFHVVDGVLEDQIRDVEVVVHAGDGDQEVKRVEGLAEGWLAHHDGNGEGDAGHPFIIEKRNKRAQAAGGNDSVGAVADEDDSHRDHHHKEQRYVDGEEDGHANGGRVREGERRGRR